MTREQAARACAMFEFPPYFCRGIMERPEEQTWALRIADNQGVVHLFTAQEWQAHYTQGQRIAAAKQQSPVDWPLHLDELDASDNGEKKGHEP